MLDGKTQGGYNALHASYDKWPKAADIASGIFLTFFFLTLFMYHQAGTLYEQHPMMSLWMFYVAILFQFAAQAYKIKVNAARNKNIFEFAFIAAHHLYEYVTHHLLRSLRILMFTMWVTSLVMKESRHPDFKFFTQLSVGIFYYFIPMVLIATETLALIIVAVLDYGLVKKFLKAATKKKTEKKG
jgi:hypothetical protein